MAVNSLRETLANLYHVQWSGWMDYLFAQGRFHQDMSFTLPTWAVERWVRQSTTEYADLSEEEKNSDRAEADRILIILTGLLSGRLIAAIQAFEEWKQGKLTDTAAVVAIMNCVQLFYTFPQEKEDLQTELREFLDAIHGQT